MTILLTISVAIFAFALGAIIGSALAMSCIIADIADGGPDAQLDRRQA